MRKVYIFLILFSLLLLIYLIYDIYKEIPTIHMKNMIMNPVLSFRTLKFALTHDYDEDDYNCFHYTIDLVRELRKDGYDAIYIGGWMTSIDKNDGKVAHAWTGVIKDVKLIEIESTDGFTIKRYDSYIYEAYEVCEIPNTGYEIYNCVDYEKYIENIGQTRLLPPR